jgi:hypothetical protein
MPMTPSKGASIALLLEYGGQADHLRAGVGSVACATSTEVAVLTPRSCRALAPARARLG